MSIKINVPDIGLEEMEVTDILVKIGEYINVDQSLIIVEGDKASIEIPALYAGIVKKISVNIGDKVRTGSLIMVFDIKNDTAESIVNADQPFVCTTLQDNNNGIPITDNMDNSLVHATPLIRSLARKFGINLSKVKGTGRKGRILREDVQDYVKSLVTSVVESSRLTNTASRSFSGLLPWPIIDFSRFGEVEQVELGKVQKISGANLHRNWVMLPHVTQFDEADITEVEAFRKQKNSEAKSKKMGIKITPLVFIMKAVAKALEELPRFNSSLSEDGQTLTLKKYINIGIAVDTLHGLFVPVLRNVNKKGIIELSRELAAMSKKACDGNKLTTADLQGGSFTISSLGGIGGTSFTPIINVPEVAILGVSKLSIKPQWNGKEFIPRFMLPLSLSYDHRVIDGADGARFICLISQIMSDIRCLVM